MGPRGLILSGALFWSAPVGAGLCGAGAFAMLPFAGLIFLWTWIMRAEPFRDGPASWLPALLLHLALASVLLGLGHLLRALSGLHGEAPLALWLALGLVALALGRLLWQPRRELEAESFLGAALRALDARAGGTKYGKQDQDDR